MTWNDRMNTGPNTGPRTCTIDECDRNRVAWGWCDAHYRRWKKHSDPLRLTQHGGRNTRLYNIWHGMRLRCLNANEPAYRWYGGKGVEICPEWSDFAAFRDWADANGYRDPLPTETAGEALSIDRIDSDGNYEPANCQWISKAANTARRFQ